MSCSEQPNEMELANFEELEMDALQAVTLDAAYSNPILAGLLGMPSGNIAQSITNLEASNDPIESVYLPLSQTNAPQTCTLSNFQQKILNDLQQMRQKQRVFGGSRNLIAEEAMKYHVELCCSFYTPSKTMHFYSHKASDLKFIPIVLRIVPTMNTIYCSVTVFDQIINLFLDAFQSLTHTTTPLRYVFERNKYFNPCHTTSLYFYALLALVSYGNSLQETKDLSELTDYIQRIFAYTYTRFKYYHLLDRIIKILNDKFHFTLQTCQSSHHSYKYIPDCSLLKFIHLEMIKNSNKCTRDFLLDIWFEISYDSAVINSKEFQQLYHVRMHEEFSLFARVMQSNFSLLSLEKALDSILRTNKQLHNLSLNGTFFITNSTFFIIHITIIELIQRIHNELPFEPTNYHLLCYFGQFVEIFSKFFIIQCRVCILNEVQRFHLFPTEKFLFITSMRNGLKSIEDGRKIFAIQTWINEKKHEMDSCLNYYYQKELSIFDDLIMIKMEDEEETQTNIYQNPFGDEIETILSLTNDITVSNLDEKIGELKSFLLTHKIHVPQSFQKKLKLYNHCEFINVGVGILQVMPVRSQIYKWVSLIWTQGKYFTKYFHDLYKCLPRHLIRPFFAKYFAFFVESIGFYDSTEYSDHNNIGEKETQ